MRGRGAQWRARQIAAMPEFGTAQMAGFISAILFVVCGTLVAAFGGLIPDGPHVHRLGVVVLGLVAVLSGIVIGSLPWHRWKRSSSLWLIPIAFAFIAMHNFLAGDNGMRYDVFFFVVFVWIGLMHPAGTSLKSAPLLVIGFLAPGLWLHDMSTLLSSLTYALPVCLLVGECASLVADRIHHSEDAVRANERRFRALVTNASDAITLLDAEGVVQWASPSVPSVLGYGVDEMVGRRGVDFVTPAHLELAETTLANVTSEPGRSCMIEIQARHADGSLRWCEARIRNLIEDPAVRGVVVNFTDVTERHESDVVRQQLAAIVESSSDAITGQTLDGVILSWNSAAERMYLYPAEQMIGASVMTLVPPENADELRSLLQRVSNGEEIDAVETRRVRRDGVVLDVSLSMSPVRDARGQVVAVAAIARDITADVQARRALADREASFRLLFAANPQPMWVYDSQTLEFLEVNDAAVAHYGYRREHFLSLHLADVLAVGDTDLTVSADGPHHAHALRHVLADGRGIEVEVVAHRLEFGGRDAVLVAIQDVTERNALDAQLRHQAFHDDLTGLANRALFADRVEHSLGRRAEGRTALLLLDLDRFKLINDSLGHAVGDELLVEVAHRLNDSVRAADTVARLGGDEFAILFEDCADGVPEQQASRLLRRLAAPMVIGGREVTVTASIGIAVAGAHATAGELLRNADVAMYGAKEAGGGRFQRFRPAMYEAAARQMELTAAMREALDRGEFLLHFQPIVDLETGQPVSMEVLTRWSHPRLGLMSPAEFIPVAEESGLILRLGAWVLREACLTAAAWATGGVNVNISARQLADPGIVHDVQRALLDSGLTPERLTLEITESVLMDNTAENMRRLHRLRDLGVRLSIDDFGTGYSSLAYLRAFPVRELKIDKTFVAGIPSDDDALSLVTSIVKLAHGMGLRTVAEGVETAAQYDALRGIGCDRAQGYYISRPGPLDRSGVDRVEGGGQVRV